MKRRAFTLVELLVVIAIIGLLSTIATMSMNQTKVNARNQMRKSNLLQISKALELYYNVNGGYPIQASWSGNCADYSGLPDTGAGAWIPNLAPTYIGSLPHDQNSSKVNPNSSTGFCRTNPGANCFLYRSDGVDYKVIAHCLPEGTLSATDAYYDSGRAAYSYAVYTPNASAW